MVDDIGQKFMLPSGISPLGEKHPLTAGPHVRQSHYHAYPPSCTQQIVGSDRSVTAVIAQPRKSHSSNDVINFENRTDISHVSFPHGQHPLSKNDTRAPSPELFLVNSDTLRPLIPTDPRYYFDGPQLPIRRTQGTDMQPSPPCNLAEYPRNEGNLKSHASIADLCDVVRAMSKEWILKLPLSTKALHLYPEQYALALLELGIRALRNYFRGKTPSGFRDLFALMHVATASLYIVYGDNHAQLWNTILEQACQWQHLLSHPIEKSTFVSKL